MQNLCRCIVHNSFTHIRRACSIDFEWLGYSFRIVCSHLPQSNKSKDEYFQALHDITALIDSRPLGSLVIVGFGAQEDPGFCDLDLFPELVGSSAEGPRNERGSAVVREVATPHYLVACNTQMIRSQTRQADGTWTCHYRIRPPFG